MAETLFYKIKYTTKLELVSGLHIGDSKDNVEIGGVDNPVVRRKDNQQPYIPGSSLKGKIRCLLEQIAGASDVGGNEGINKVFGIAKKENTIPSRIIFRDAYLDDASVEMLKGSPNTDMPFTELKFENSIDRIKGVADNPRQQERIPAGASFKLEFVINAWGDSEDKANANANTCLDMLKRGLKALENDYLGGSGSRGYGQVKIDIDGMKSEKIAL